MKLSQAAVLRAARKLRLAGYAKDAAKLLVIARDRNDVDTEKDLTVDIDPEYDDAAYKANHDHAVVKYLKWLGHEMHPMLNKYLKEIKRMLTKEHDIEPKIALEGIMRSLKVYGFKALEGTAVPYEKYGPAAPQKAHKQHKELLKSIIEQLKQPSKKEVRRWRGGKPRVRATSEAT